MQRIRPQRICLVGLLLACVGYGSAQTTNIAPNTHTDKKTLVQSMAVAGNDQAVWLIVGRFDPQEKVFVYRFARLETSSSRLEPMLHIRPQKGTMQRWAAVGDELHVFFAADATYPDQGAHYCYDSMGSGARAPLPGPVMPLAVAGVSSTPHPTLWAVVSAQTAADVAARWQQAQQESLVGTGQLAESALLEMETELQVVSSESKPAARGFSEHTKAMQPARSAIHLVRFEGMVWQPGLPGPQECTEADRIWLAAGGDEQFHLLWRQRAGPAVLSYARWDTSDQRWNMGAPLPLDRAPELVFVGLINRNLLVSALVPGLSRAGELVCQSWVWTEGGLEGSWMALPGLLASADKDRDGLSPPTGSALGGFADKLVVMQPAAEGAEVALFSPLAGGAPTQGFEQVPLVSGTSNKPSEKPLRDLAATLAVAALLLLVFWRRQEAVMAPVALPAGTTVARPGKRIVAAVLDMLPAGIVVVIVWFTPLRQFADVFWPAFMSGRSEMIERVPWPETLTWAWVSFRILYTAYGIVFELIWRMTPGKRLMGCEVHMETFEPVRRGPIIIRNITKMIELEPYLQVWPFVLVIFFTRNHQRLGDLLGRTIVIQRQPIVFDFKGGHEPAPPSSNDDTSGDHPS